VDFQVYLLPEGSCINLPSPPLAGVGRVVATTRRVIAMGSLSNVLWIAQVAGTEHMDGHFTSIYGTASE